MERKTVFAAIVSLGAVLALLGGAWYLVNRRNAEACPFCGRGIHRQTRVLVRLGGQNYETCCLRCAITEAQQTGKQLRMLKVADFATTKLFDPDKAWFVEGSRVNYCISMSPAVASPGRESVAMRAFDRCSPSVYAFSTEQQARAFMAQRGGVLKRLDDLLREANSTAGKVQKP
jgi:hypothetical protein